MHNLEDLQYYLKELKYLHEEGARFAERNPKVAFHLGQGGDGLSSDPHAERIVESFAFLTGKLNRFLDAQFPELVHSLFQMLYPYYLRPTPAKTLLHLAPKLDMLDVSRDVPKGTEVKTGNIGRHGHQYSFTTCWDTWVHPLEIGRFFIDPDVLASHSMTLELQLHKVTNMASINWHLLDFLIHGEGEDNPQVRFHLFLHFSKYLKEIRIRGVERYPFELVLEWVGFHMDHTYNDEDEGRFAHIHYLRDYFDYPQRFYYFRIKGLEKVLKDLADAKSVQIDFIFNQAPPTGYKPEASHILVNTTVAHNLFDMELEAFLVNEESYEYELTPDSERVDQEVASMIEVLATQDRDEEELRPYYRFQHHHINRDRQWFYALRRDGDPKFIHDDKNTSRGWRTYIRFIDGSHLGPGALEGWTISPKARCTNGLHAQKLQIGQLNRLSGKYKDIISPRNLTKASAALWPKLTGEAEWQFLAHLALDYSEFHDPDALKTLLNLYIHRDEGGILKRKVEGIIPDKPKADYIVRNGGSIPGEKLKLTVDAGCFKNALGDIALFSMVMGHFLKAYTSINSFLKLEVHEPTANITFSHTAWGDE